jgi:hypothetical protein
MIDVADDELGEAECVQAMQERDGITTTGDGNEVASCAGK